MTAPPAATPTTPPAGPDDDQQWFDLLAGRRAHGASAGTQAQAAALRTALQRHRPPAPAGQPAPADARIGRLLARARAEGVLPPPDARPQATAPLAPAARPAPPRRRPLWAGALAAGVAALGLALLLRPAGPPGADTPPAADTLRGTAVQQWTVADPLQRRQQLLQALRDAGFDAQPFDRLGRAGLDIALPVPLPPAQARALAGLGIKPPPGPSLQIELLPAAPASAPVAR